MNKITRSFAAASLSLAAILAGPAVSAEPELILATQEELTIPNKIGQTFVNQKSVLFSACTADNYRVTSHLFLTANPVMKQRMIKDHPLSEQLRNVYQEGYYKEYEAGAKRLTAADFLENLQHSTIPLMMRQHMNYMARGLNKDGSPNETSWQLRSTNVSATRDPSCNVQTKNMALR
jgi:hypothetical protein